MKNLLGLALVLAAFWLINSGYLYPLLLSLGAVSVALTIWLTRRAGTLDNTRYPVIFPSWRLPVYLLWLAWEIIKSNLTVVRCIWSREPPISPTIVRLKATQKTDAARAFYANSITMTPGTITLDVQGDELEVHALTRAAASDLLAGGMDRQVSRLETG